MWCSGTSYGNGYILTMQPDANLVMYDPYGNSIWWTGTNYGYTNAYLIMQNDGNLVIYDDSYGLIWNLGTQQSNFYVLLFL